MAIRDIITMGFGNGTFSPGVRQIVRLGYGVSTVAGPFVVVANDFYNAGSTENDFYNAGSQVNDYYHPGSVESDWA